MRALFLAVCFSLSAIIGGWAAVPSHYGDKLDWPYQKIADVQPGDSGVSPFFCKDKDATVTFAGQAEKNEAGAISAAVLDAAADELLLSGGCVFLPNPVNLTYVELIDTGDALDLYQVWKVIVDGKPWFVMHKAGEKS